MCSRTGLEFLEVRCRRHHSHLQGAYTQIGKITTSQTIRIYYKILHVCPVPRNLLAPRNKKTQILLFPTWEQWTSVQGQ